MSSKRPRPEGGTDEKKKRHRPEPNEDRRPAWKRAQDLPAFLDASASVSASTFGARRLPEIKALWDTAVRPKTELIPSEESLRSSGGKTSSRHLRRRTTSHNSRKRHRFPTASKETPDKEKLTRRSIRKDKVALEKGHQLWWKLEERSTLKDDAVESQQQQEHEPSDKEKNTIVQWMTTHLWHAKRFHMSDLWGWRVPMMHTNRGAKAALRLIREGKTLIQDATWQMAQPIHILAPCIMDQQETIVATIRRVCPEFQMNLAAAAVTSTCTGQGMIYALDQFPRHAIGPVSWLVSSNRPLMGEQVNLAYTKHCYIYFWVHPSIRCAVSNEFKALQDETSSATPMVIQRLNVGFQADDTGMACLQLRGTNVTSTIQKAIVHPTNVPENNSVWKAGNQSLWDDEKLHVHVPHGTVVPACANCDLPPSKALDEDAITNAWISGNFIVLISQCFRDPANLPQNAPALGWNILCDASIAKDLFLKLILSGQACPIGVTESAYINLECEPPMANVFPRDYPETQQGRDYWQLNTAGKSCDDLQVLRLCLEKGEAGARVPVPLINKRVRSPPPTQPRTPKVSTQRLCKIEWNNLINKEPGEDNADGSDERGDVDSEVVVMRGIFGQPLEDALSGAGTIPFRDDPSKSTRRKRRRTKQPNEFCRALPLTPEDAEKHLATCTSLLESLSLPAVVACRLQIVGPGTIGPGAEIHSCEDEQSSRLLGYTTAGCFSISRGSSHGIGVVGAANLLKAILWGTSSAQQSTRAFAVVGSRAGTNGNDKRQMHLQVEIKTKQLSTKATLALML